MKKVVAFGAIFAVAAVIGGIVAVALTDDDLKRALKNKGMSAVTSVATIIDGVSSLKAKIAEGNDAPTLADEWALVDAARNR